MDSINEKYQQRYIDKSRGIVSKYLQKLETLPGKPNEFEYFENILKKVFIDNDVVKYNDDEKFIGSFCCTMPSEIICAAKARQINLCSNSYVGFHIGDYEAPRDLCPLIKAAVGNATSKISKIYDACDMYIVPVACDGKKKLASILANYKTTLPLYLPTNRDDDEGMEIYIKELKNIASAISSITGVEVTRKSLLEQIKIHADVQRQINRFFKLKSNDDILIRGTHALAIMNSMAYDDIVSWGKHLKKLNDELSSIKDTGTFLTRKKLPRILVIGSPIIFPNIKVPLIIEEQGGVVVLQETCLADRGINNLVSICNDSLDGYYRALANRYLKPNSCSVFPDSKTRVSQIDKLVKDNHIDGIVYCVFRGCLLFDYEYEKIDRHFNDKGIPTIRIESDFNDEDYELLQIRLEAFVEMIKFKKNKEDVDNA